MAGFSTFVVTGNYSDSPVACDMGTLLDIPLDIADVVSLKTFANSEFCPRFIPDLTPDHKVGHGLAGQTVIISSGCSPPCRPIKGLSLSAHHK